MNNVLVTGGAGFIGSNFIRYMLNHTSVNKVYNLDSLTYAGNLKNLRGIDQSRYMFIHGNILDHKLLAWINQKFFIDTIVHFAAETHVDRSIVHPQTFFETNVMGTFNILDVILTVNPKVRFHHISTDEVYGELDEEDASFSEVYCYSPNSPYAASKASSDHIVRSFGHTYGLNYTISNCSNNYGPYQFPEKLIPRMVLSALEGKPLPVHGDGTNIRDWLYVKDHCEAIVKILESGTIGETYNIGGSQEHRNIDVVNIICELMDEWNPKIEYVKDRLGNDKRYSIDSSKIQKELGWFPKTSFEVGIRETVKWYKDNQEWLFETRDMLNASNFDIFYKKLKV